MQKVVIVCRGQARASDLKRLISPLALCWSNPSACRAADNLGSVGCAHIGIQPSRFRS